MKHVSSCTGLHTNQSERFEYFIYLYLNRFFLDV